MELIEIAGRHGFTSIMLPPDAKVEALKTDIVDVIKRAGIERVVLDGALAMLPRCPFVERHGLTVDELLRTADRFQVDCFNVPHYQGDPNTSIQEFVDALGPFCEAAASRRAEVSLEFLPGTGIPDMQRAVQIVEAVSAGNMGITLDTWHWARSGASVEDIRLLPKGVIKDLQVNDRSKLQQGAVDSMQWGRLLPGAGDLPLADIHAVDP